MAGVYSAIARRGPWLMLLARTALFAFYQALIALVFLIAGDPEPWARSTAWWPLSAILANADTLGLLWLAAKREGIRVWHLYNFDRTSVKRDLLWLAGAVVVSAPLAYFPNVWLAEALFEDPTTPFTIMFQPLPPWMLWTALLLFPLTIALTELPAYYGYAMPTDPQAGGQGVVGAAARRGRARAAARRRCRSCSSRRSCCGDSGCSCPSRSSSGT
jgi:hypothetical protein